MVQHVVIVQADRSSTTGGYVTVYDPWPKNGAGTGPGQTYTWTHDQVNQRATGPVVIITPAPGTPGGPTH